MAKAESSRQATQSGRPPGAGFKGKGKPDKSIKKTSDLIKGNAKAKASGKGKERAVLGEVAQVVERERRSWSVRSGADDFIEKTHARWYTSRAICRGERSG